MPERDEPEEPADRDEQPKPPAAAQWMMQQATGHQPATDPVPPALPAPHDVLSLQAGAATPNAPQAAAPLAERERRVVSGLVGNKQVTEGLDEAAARELMAWGVELARGIVADTAGLDDAAAEAVLQRRVRATRRLMMSTGRAVNDPAAAGEYLDEALKQAAIALGDRFAPPAAAESAALRLRWRAQEGRPRDQIAGLRHLFIDSSRSES